jgi:hypothetical protein
LFFVFLFVCVFFFSIFAFGKFCNKWPIISAIYCKVQQSVLH